MHVVMTDKGNIHMYMYMYMYMYNRCACAGTAVYTCIIMYSNVMCLLCPRCRTDIPLPPILCQLPQARGPGHSEKDTPCLCRGRPRNWLLPGSQLRGRNDSHACKYCRNNTP